jgi:hypothetical protein
MDRARKQTPEFAAMNESIFYTFVIGGLITISGIAFFIWGAMTGAFEHTEDAKYILFRDDDDDE